jgi:hypothetical protein
VTAHLGREAPKSVQSLRTSAQENRECAGSTAFRTSTWIVSGVLARTNPQEMPSLLLTRLAFLSRANIKSIRVSRRARPCSLARWSTCGRTLLAHPPQERILEFPKAATHTLPLPVFSRFAGSYHQLAIGTSHRPPVELVHGSRIACKQPFPD